MELIRHLDASYHAAEQGRSKIGEDVISLPGMTGTYTRHFYNNLCSMPNTRYLEIGSWKGSSIAAAMNNNKMDVCIAIDNWSEFGGPKDEFVKVFTQYKGENNASFIEKNCFDPDLIQSLSPYKFNIYMYDGYHSEQAQYDALVKYLPCLDDTFIWVVDDWNAPEVRAGTTRAIQDTGVSVLWKQETRSTWNNSHSEMSLAKATWWNGFAAFVIQKV
jgi:hypothetical protein